LPFKQKGAFLWDWILVVLLPLSVGNRHGWLPLLVRNYWHIFFICSYWRSKLLLLYDVQYNEGDQKQKAKVWASFGALTITIYDSIYIYIYIDIQHMKKMEIAKRKQLAHVDDQLLLILGCSSTLFLIVSVVCGLKLSSLEVH
jgi:hypothetical protein